MRKTPYQLFIGSSARKFIKKQDRQTQIRILEALDQLLFLPPRGDIKRLRGVDDLFRLRIGSLRALFCMNHIEQKIVIENIDNRGDIYKKGPS